MKKGVLQAKDLLKTTGILKSSPEKTLKQALAQLTRTHDAVFVFDEREKFLGVINPYYAIFKSNNPPETKLENCLFNPPHLTPNTYIWDVARLMAESKIYFLPVFEQNSKFVGIVSVNRVFKAICDRPELINRLKIQTKKDILTVRDNSTLLQTYNLIRDKQVARLPVVDARGKLLGIVTRYDIRAALTEPKQRMRWQSRAGDKEKYLAHPLEGYFRKMVVTAKPDALAREILQKMVAKEVGSVVIVDQRFRPIGIVSSKDILTAIANLRPKKSTEIDLQVDESFIQQARLEEILSRFVGKMNLFNPVRRIGFVVEGVKNPAGKIKRYTVRSLVLLKSGRRVAAKVTEYDWKKAVRETLAKLRRQLPS